MHFHTHQLYALGWNDFFSEHFKHYVSQGLSPARVVSEQRDLYSIFTTNGEIPAKMSGKLRHQAMSRTDLPAVGDWVAVTSDPAQKHAIIHAILPRRSKFTRKSAGARTEEQIVAANIDTIFLMTSLNQDFNLRRMERYLIVAWNSGATPVILLSKSDLCVEVGNRIAQMDAIAPGVPVHAISVIDQTGVRELTRYLQPGQTVGIVGSSGVGKSTLVNYLLGDLIIAVQPIRSGDDRGRHTTTHRELIPLPGGGLILDTPGMRELQLWNAEEGFDVAFPDIEEFASRCYYRNCRHRDEPGCAVQHAVQTGSLDPERFSNFQKLQKELSYLQIKQDVLAQNRQRQKWKTLSRMAKERSIWKRR